MSLTRIALTALGIHRASGAPYVEENKLYNMNNNADAADARHFKWTDPVPDRRYFPSPDDWRKHPVYQIVVDRFCDGDPRNNAQHDGFIYDWQRNEGPFTGFDVRDLTTRQGGDWRGLASKLDYILGMGCRAMWISPVQQNTDNSPMGYLGVDKTLLERRFGNLEDFRFLIDEAHKRGMYIVVDIVNNHMAEMLDWVSTSVEDETMQFRMHRGGATSSPLYPNREAEPKIRPKMKVLKACEKTPGCDPQTYQPYVDYPFENTWYDEGKYPGLTYREAGFSGMPLGIPDANGTGGYWNSSFHHSGEMPESEEGPWNWPLGKLYGTLDDLRTTEDKVVDKLIAASVSIITALDIDGFRLDTPRECAYTSWTRWRTAIDEGARRVGKSNFGTWGELWSTPERAATYMGRGKDIPMYFYDGPNPADKFINPNEPIFDGLIDYNYFSWIVTVFRRSIVSQAYMAFNILEWETTMGYDIEWPSFPVNGTGKVPRYQMWTFCGSHDQHRFSQFPLGSERLRLCYAWLYSWPGIPVTYQGDEQALSTPGSGLAYWGREFMASSAAWAEVPTVLGPDGKLANPANSNNFDQGSDYYRFYRRLLEVRDLWWEGAFACLGDGPDGSGLPQRIECVSTDGTSHPVDGVFGYRRTCQKGKWGVVMLLNLENATHHVRCDGLLTVAAPGPVFNAMHQADGHASPFQYEALPNLLNITLRPFETKAIVNERKAFRLQVDTVSPRHDIAMSLDAWQQQQIEITFTEGVEPDSVKVEIDGLSVLPTSWEEDRKRLLIQLPTPNVDAAFARLHQEGVHTIRVLTASSSRGHGELLAPYSFRVRVGKPSNPIVSNPLHVDHSLIVIEDSGDVYLEHPAAGAEYFRAQHAGGKHEWDRASAWVPLNGSKRTLWGNFRPGIPLVVQYYVDGSAAYLVTACRVSAAEACHASYYQRGPGMDVMSFKGNLNQWEEDTDWSFQPPREDTGDHNWTIDIHISLPDTPFLIDITGDDGHLLGVGNDVTNPFFFPFEAFCFGTLSNKPRGAPQAGCHSPLKGPLAGIKADLCTCDMKIQTLFLEDSGLNHTNRWMMHHFPEFWARTDAHGRPVFHGLMQYVADASSGLYNLHIPASICPLHSACRITLNDLTLTFAIGPSPPGVRGLGAGSLEVAAVLCLIWVAVPLVAAVTGLVRRRNGSVVMVVAPEAFGGGARLSMPMDEVSPSRRVLVASLEHIVAHADGVEKAVAGGLGKVAGLLCQYHPGPLVCVHACMPGGEYSFATEDEHVHAVVSGKPLICTVYKYTRPDLEEDPGVEEDNCAQQPQVTYYFIDHTLFRDRTDIYPTPQTRRQTLELYSLWNQAVARIIDRVRPDIYHCPDFHAAMAVMYLERPIPIVIVLHNAEYQGAISTQHMGRREASWFGEIFDLPAERIRRELFHEGKFSMLKPAVDHVRRHQAGYGICAVSRNYALEAAQKHSVLWGLPEVHGIENCMPDSERMEASASSAEALLERKREAKLSIQQLYNLQQDANARIFVFVGRWVKQKGVDYIADIADWMLSTYPDSQLLMIGPVGDPYGCYAKEKMEDLQRSGRFSKNLFVHADFLLVHPQLKLACDFCLMPSRDEPFGYVDIEFGWYGAIVVGSLRGGLGKLPGFYFQIMNADSSSHMQRQLKKAIAKAMACNTEMLEQMSTLARRSSFPVNEWQNELLQLYGKAHSKFDWAAVGRAPRLEDIINEIVEGKGKHGAPRLPCNGQDDDAEQQATSQPAAHSPRHVSMDASSASSGSPQSLVSPLGIHTGRSQRQPHSYRMPCSARSQLPSHRSGGVAQPTGRSQQPTARSQLPSHRSGAPGQLTARSQAKSQIHTHRSACSDHTAVSVVDLETFGGAENGGEAAGLPASKALNRGAEKEAVKAAAGAAPEFLHQEPAEAEVRRLVGAKLRDRSAPCSADALLEEVEWELEMAQESSRLARLLGRWCCGAPVLDWIICWTYITGPLVATLPISRFSGEAWAYFLVDPMVQALAVIFWTVLARMTSPHLLMASASLARLSFCVLPVLNAGPLFSAVVVGFVVPADYLFIYYSFMGSSVGDISKLAVRTGLLIAIREVWEWICKGISCDSSSMRICLFVAAVVFSVLPAIALLNAPKLYREFRFPAFDFTWIKKLRFLTLLGLGCILQRLTHVSDSALPVLRQTSPFVLQHRPGYFLGLGAATFIPIYLLSKLLERTPSYAMIVVKGLACFSLPGVLLRCWAQYEINQSVELTWALDAVIFTSVVIGALSVYSVAVSVLAVVGSRWRFISYTCLIGVGSNLARMLSFIILTLRTGKADPLRSKYLPQALAWELFLVALLPCAAATILSIFAFLCFDREATGMLRTSRQRRLGKLARSQSGRMPQLLEESAPAAAAAEASWEEEGEGAEEGEEEEEEDVVEEEVRGSRL